jgi:hypothetical protein
MKKKNTKQLNPLAVALLKARPPFANDTVPDLCSVINYFAPAPTKEEEVLRRILGNFRRGFVGRAIKEGGLASIPESWTASSISEVLKSMLQRQHPTARGGEDLPDLAKGGVEIARMTLANSVHGEVTSLRARRGGTGGKIRFRMVDEYQSDIELPISTATAPLSAEEVLAMFRDSDPSQTDTDCEIEFQSFFYPDLDKVARQTGLK